MVVRTAEIIRAQRRRDQARRAAKLPGLIACLALTHAALADSPAPAADAAAQWRRQAQNVEIVRDQWGIAHIYGATDADAVFGGIYAQAEDDFSRIERNYLVALGWLAKAEGESALYLDLRQRLFVDPARLQVLYRSSPGWLKKLLVAWADGLNYFLRQNPEVHPKVILHFEPWMALSFTEGSIGGDIESVDSAALERFYAPSSTGARSGAPSRLPATDAPGGSNGFAIAPSRSASGHALLWINPHTSFYFRSELHLVSGEGLNAYGAATWGQFFIYQGFNAHNGWMHTSYGGDAIDEYAESIVERADGTYYRYGRAWRKMRQRLIDIEIKQADRTLIRRFRVYDSHHGPIVRAADHRWIAVKLLQDPVRALEQSYLRTKTADYRSFRAIQNMRTDTSNNTVYADADGTIGYFHGNFIPRRDPRFDFTHPVDGSDPATEWHGAHELSETITLLNPGSGWILNTNNWPFSAAGAASPRADRYPRYMWTRGENPRGLHAAALLQESRALTLDGLIALAYDSRLNAFDALLPPLLEAYDRLPPGDPRRASLDEPIETLRRWDRRTATDSVATAVAIFWGQAMAERASRQAHDAEVPVYDFLVAHSTDAQRIDSLSAAVAKLERDFGRWQTPWGEINRFQRLTDDIVQPFDDGRPSLPVAFASSQWGALAAFDSSGPRTTKRIYGSEGNSFVAAVEFGPTIHAKAVITGGESGDPSSAHFADQALLYSRGEFRDVLFAREDVLKHAERRYHPGESR